MRAGETIIISTLNKADIEKHLNDLGGILHASVHAGASVGFVLPFSAADSEAYWRETVRPELDAGGLLLLVAVYRNKAVGTVQLNHGTPANQPHRADVKKLLVHPDVRRRGIARALMAELERHAIRLGRRLLTLDTRTGDDAEPLYASLGYRTAGVIPGYCIDAIDQEQYDSTTVMYKMLGHDGDAEN